MAMPVGMSPCALKRSTVDRVAVAVAALRQSVEHAAHPVVEHRGVGVLHDGDALGRLGDGGGGAVPAIGEQQDCGRQPDQRHAEGQPFDCVEHEYREAELGGS